MKYLAIDSDVELAEREAAAWKSEMNFDMVRVDTMTEGIEKLKQGSFMYVGINSDVVDFLPLLGLMRKVTNTPIFIATSSYTHEKQAVALSKGADMYGEFRDTSGNIESVMANIEAHTRKNKTLLDVAVCRDVIVTESNEVYVSGKPVRIHRKEVDVLRLLMDKRGIHVTSTQILSEVWKDDVTAGEDLVWRTVDRLRSELAKVSDIKYIVQERNMGYMFAV